MTVITQDVALDAVRYVLGAKNKEVDGELTPETQIETLGLDSLDLSELFLNLEERSGTELDPASAEGLQTIGDLVKLRPL